MSKKNLFAPVEDDKNFFIKNIKPIAICCVAIVIVIGLVLLVSKCNASGMAKDADAGYAVFKPYLELPSDAGDADREKVLEQLRQADFPVSGVNYSRVNLYAADLLSAFGRRNEESDALKNIVDHASRDNYIRQIAMYRLACNYEADGKSDDAQALYQAIWKDYDKESAFSERALFALFRISYLKSDKDAYTQYKDLLDKNFGSGDYTRYVDSVVTVDSQN